MRRLIANDTIRRFLRSEQATTVIEYALIASGLSVAIIGTVTTLGSALKTNFYDKVLHSFRSLSA